jgi:hypothetical protein
MSEREEHTENFCVYCVFQIHPFSLFQCIVSSLRRAQILVIGVENTCIGRQYGQGTTCFSLFATSPED